MWSRKTCFPVALTRGSSQRRVEPFARARIARLCFYVLGCRAGAAHETLPLWHRCLTPRSRIHKRRRHWGGTDDRGDSSPPADPGPHEMVRMFQSGARNSVTCFHAPDWLTTQRPAVVTERLRDLPWSLGPHRHGLPPLPSLIGQVLLHEAGWPCRSALLTAVGSRSAVDRIAHLIQYRPISLIGIATSKSSWSGCSAKPRRARRPIPHRLISLPRDAWTAGRCTHVSRWKGGYPMLKGLLGRHQYRIRCPRR